MHVPDEISIDFFVQEGLLPFVHFPENNAAMDLSGREGNMKQWSRDFEGDLPAIPETSEQKHRHDGFAKSAKRGGYTRG